MHRIAIIGPVEPFRSGVARHTTALARALAGRPATQVRVYSFSRQYPRRLFPGESDREVDAHPPADLDVRFIIDSLNPLSWLAAARQVTAFDPHLVVAPAWTFFLAPCLAAVVAHVRFWQGAPAVSVVHNAADHERSAMKVLLSKMQLLQASAYVTHTHALAESIRNVVAGAKVEVCVHPVFHYPKASGTLSKRADLELLQFGLLRPYKGLDVLLDALALLPQRSLHLSVVGEAWQDLATVKRKVASLGLEDRVELVPRHVSDVEAAEYFARADAVVLPYRSVTGSGVLPLAFHYGKPVIVSDLPGLLELIEESETGWSFPVGDADSLARLLAQHVTRAACVSMLPAISGVSQTWSFDRFAEVVARSGGLVSSPG
jgi:D-inositol-3-phosphate glycosyltransferase